MLQTPLPVVVAWRRRASTVHLRADGGRLTPLLMLLGACSGYSGRMIDMLQISGDGNSGRLSLMSSRKLRCDAACGGNKQDGVPEPDNSSKVSPPENARPVSSRPPARTRRS
jgi:hypothetical protein